MAVAEAMAEWDRGRQERRGDHPQSARPEDRTSCASPTSAPHIGACISRVCTTHRDVHLPRLHSLSESAAPF